ncbi:MAG: 4Fe-4S binding protein [candidate division WOR-3 bacterium]
MYNKYIRITVGVSAFFTVNNHFSTDIYQGVGKRFLFPGLNCYSCPLARFSCPIGTIQSFIVIRNFPFYAIGFLAFLGITLGRVACGWICPFGFLQEFLYKIKTFKIQIPEKYNYSKFFVLFFLVILLPLFTFQPWFCKLCPQGGIEAGIPLVLLNSFIRLRVGWFFYVKISIVLVFISYSVLIKRPFCRFCCPLGAIYGLFNKFTFFKIMVDEKRCTECLACHNICPMDIEIFNVPDSIDCIRCGLCIKKCPTGALSFSYGFTTFKEKEVRVNNG